MCARRNEYLCRCAALVAIVLLLPPLTWSQWDTRPPGRLAPLTSRPAAVSLVATLESLSVSALPTSLAISASHAGVPPSLTVTTAWTLRANCTTLRLSGYSGALAAFVRDPLSVLPSDKTDRLALYATHPLVVNDTNWTGISQPVGATSHPGNRTDNVELAIDRKDKSGSVSPPSAIYIFAQAL
jgi:hypothetical protein